MSACVWVGERQDVIRRTVCWTTAKSCWQDYTVEALQVKDSWISVEWAPVVYLRGNPEESPTTLQYSIKILTYHQTELSVDIPSTIDSMMNSLSAYFCTLRIEPIGSMIARVNVDWTMTKMLVHMSCGVLILTVYVTPAPHFPRLCKLECHSIPLNRRFTQ